MSTEQIIDKLKGLARYEVTKYKSTPKKEVLEYRKCPEFGRFVIAYDLEKIIKELEASE